MTVPCLDLKTFRIDEAFSRPMPLEVEIGCGKGRFALDYAAAHPEMNLIGIDLLWRFLKLGKLKADRQKVPNLRFYKIGAVEFISGALENKSVRAFHIYFPDPWPKRRHHGRRLVNKTFLGLLARKAADKAHVFISTDHAHYFESIRRSASESDEWWKVLRESENIRPWGAPGRTNYEIKYGREGRKINYLELEKV